MNLSLHRWAFCFCAAVLSACGGGSGASDTDSSETSTAATRSSAPADPSGGMGADLPAELTEAPDAAATELPQWQQIAAQPGAVRQSERAMAVSPAAGTLLTQSGFEGSYAGTAPGWRMNYWGAVKFEVARETRAGFFNSGSAAQRLRIAERAAGADAHLVYPYGFVQGKTYRAVVYLRTDSSAQVEVQLRRDASPWNVFATKTVTLGSGWTRVELQGQYGWGDPGSIRIISRTTGANIYIDDMSLADASAPVGGTTLPASGATGVNLVTLMDAPMEGSYTQSAPGWRMNAWGTPAPSFELARETRSGYVYEGGASQRFRLVSKGGGDAQLIYPYAFVKDRTYRLTAYIRSDVPARATLFMRRDVHPYDPFATRTLQLGTTWQKVEIQGSYLGGSGGSIRLNSLTPGANIWLDKVTLSEVRHNDLAPYSTSTIPDTLFGMHVNKFDTHHNWPGLGTHIVRLHNTLTHWKDVEPSNNGWNWKRLDAIVDYARRNNPNGTLLYTLGLTPAWASSNPTQWSLYGNGAAAPPANMEDWRDYVRNVARRYVGRIRYWELWNEPDYRGHFTGSMAQMVTMARIAREEIKAADPANVVISPGLTTGQGASFLDSFLAEGGGQQVDAIGYHWYTDIRPEALRASIENVRQIMRNHGIGAKPLWNTEGAPLCNREWQDCGTWVPSLQDQRSAGTRALLMMAAKGVANFNYYVWEIGDPLSQLVKPDWVTPTSAAQAYGEMVRWLKGARIVDAFRVNENIHVFRLNRGSENYTVLWSAAGNTVVNLPSAWGATRLRKLDTSETGLPANGQITLGAEPVMVK